MAAAEGLGARSAVATMVMAAAQAAGGRLRSVRGAGMSAGCGRRWCGRG